MSINTIGTSQANTAGFIPQIWANRALDILRNKIVLANIVARDFEYGEFKQGNTLNIPYPGTFTAQDKVANTLANVQQTSNAATVQVTLSQHKTVDFIIEDVAQAQANSNLMDRYMNGAVVALAEALETYLWTFYSSMSLSSVGTAGTGLTHATITAAQQALNVAKAPQEDRHIIYSAKDQTSLISDSSLSTYFAFGQNQAIRTGDIGPVDGFTLHMSQLVPVVAGTPNATQNLAIHKDAILLACRPLPEYGETNGVDVAVVSDSKSGLSIRCQSQYNIGYRGLYVAFDILYGAVALRPNQGVVVLS